MKKSLLLLVALLFVGLQTVIAQTKIKGHVVDGDSKSNPKEGLIGANVKISGTNAGTQTDIDGNFELDLPANGSGKIEISYLGYATQNVAATDGIEVTLQKSENVLVDVVITSPYGAPIAKEDYVGAGDVVSAKKIENTPVADITKSIEGAAPGVQVTNGSGAPGSGASIQIRGRGSLSANTEPLIVLDGAPYDGDITSINPMDVASMSILKDAMATSLYGARGSNGVILVTTKRGRSGEKPRITVDGKVGTVTRGLPSYDVITDPKDYYEIAWRGQYNKNFYGTGLNAVKSGTDASGLTTPLGVVEQLGYNSYSINGVGDSLQNAYLLDPVTGKLNPNAQLKYKDDWQKEMQRVGVRQDYNFSVSSASDKSDYYLSAGYLNEKGYIINSDYSRFTTRLNVNTQATDWLRIGLNVSGSMSTNNGTGTQTGSGANTGNPIFVAMTTAPIYPVFYRDSNNNKVIDPLTGDYKYDYGSVSGDPGYSNGTRGNVAGENIIGQLKSRDLNLKTMNVVAIPYLDIKLNDHLNFVTRFNTSFTNYNQRSYTSREHGTSKPLGGSLSRFSENDFSYTWNQQLTYQKVFNKIHDFSITAAHESYYKNIGYTSGYVTGFISDEFREFDVATGTPTLESRTDNERMESYLAVANYTLNDKYLFQANVRRDGLSRFSPESRWGNFGGAGVGWVLSRENFLKDVSWLSNLKLKASYGTTGNNAVTKSDGSQNYYGYQALYDVSRPNGNKSAAIPLTLQNNALTWETQKAVNIGAEFSLFKDRISGEVNVYNRQTADLYLNVPNPPSTGIYSQLLNTGSMRNRGIELNIYATAVRSQNFTWTINANWSKNVNKITYLADGRDSLIKTDNTILRPGYDFTSFYLVHSAGINPLNGDELYTYLDTLTNTMKSDTGYNTIQSLNRQIAGNATPKFQGAITNTFAYKGFEFSFLITYSVGGKYYDNTYEGLMGNALTKIGSTNFSKDILNSWTPDNPNATLPRFEWDNANNSNVSDRFLIDASYISIRNVNLRYSIPKNLVAKAKLSSLSAYIAADNVAFFSKRAGMNPQGSFNGQVQYPYNPSRTIMFGLTVGL